MAGQRLLDFATLLKASRAVANKHLELRQNQWARFAKTSSLLKADGFRTLRQNSLQHTQRRQAGSNTSGTSTRSRRDAGSGSNVPSRESVAPDSISLKHEGIKQDHFYTQSTRHATADNLPDGKLGLNQEKASRYPLPDGTIPPSGAPLASGRDGNDLFTAPLQVEDQNRSLGAYTQQNVFRPQSSSRGSIPNPEQAIADHNREIQRQSERQIPTEVAKPPPAARSNPDDIDGEEPSASTLTKDQGKDVYYEPPTASGKVLSGLPRTKLPKTSETIQEGNPHVPDERLNQDVFYSSADSTQSNPGAAEVEGARDEALTEEQYSEIFHSPRIANLLRKNLESTERNVPDPKSPWRQQKKSFSTYCSTRSSPRKDDDNEMASLAADIAKDAEATAQVRILQSLIECMLIS